MRTAKVVYALAFLAAVATSVYAAEPACNVTLPANSNSSTLQSYLDTVTDGYPVAICLPSGEFGVTAVLSNPMTPGGSAVTLIGSGSEGPSATMIVPAGSSALCSTQNSDFAVYHASFNLTSFGGQFTSTVYLEDIVIYVVNTVFLTSTNGFSGTLFNVRTFDVGSMGYVGDFINIQGNSEDYFHITDSSLDNCGTIVIQTLTIHVVNSTFTRASSGRSFSIAGSDLAVFKNCEFSDVEEGANAILSSLIYDYSVINCSFHDLAGVGGTTAFLVYGDNSGPDYFNVSGCDFYRIAGTFSSAIMSVNEGGPMWLEDCKFYDMDQAVQSRLINMNTMSELHMNRLTVSNITFAQQFLYLRYSYNMHFADWHFDNVHVTSGDAVFYLFDNYDVAVIRRFVIRNCTCDSGKTLFEAQKSALDFYDSTFEDNVNYGNNPHFHLDGDPFENVTFTRCNFTNNFGGGTVLRANNLDIYTTDCVFSCNAGGVFTDLFNGRMLLTNTLSTDNYFIDQWTRDYFYYNPFYYVLPDAVMANSHTSMVGFVEPVTPQDPRSCPNSPPLVPLACENGGTWYYDRVNAFYGACDCSGTGYGGTLCTVDSTAPSPEETSYDPSVTEPIDEEDTGCTSDEWDSPSDGCVPCPLGAFCNGTEKIWPLSGFWSPDPYSEPVECGVPGACPGTVDDDGGLIECDKKGRGKCKNKDKKDKGGNGNGSNNRDLLSLDSEYGTNNGSSNGTDPATDTCNNKYRNFACADCDSEHFRDNQRCFECGPNGAAKAAGLLVVNAFVIGSIAVFGLFLKDKLLDKYVSLLMAVQLFVVSGKDFSRHIPDPVGEHVATGYRWLSVLNFDVEFMQLDCLAGEPYDFPQIFFATVGLFALSIALFIVTAVVYSVFVTSRGKTHLPLRRTVINRSIHVLVVLGMAGYLQIGLRVFQAFDCVRLYSDRKLHVQYTIECGSADHSSTLILAVIVFIYYILGFPAFIFYITSHRPGAAANYHRSGVLVRNWSETMSDDDYSEVEAEEEEQQSQSSSSLGKAGGGGDSPPLDPAVVDYIQRYGFLVRELRPGAFWFQSFKFVVMFTIVLQLAVPRSAGVKLLTNVCVMLTNVLLIGLVWPYTSRRTNGMNMLTGTLTALQTAIFLTGIVDRRFAGAGIMGVAFAIVVIVIGILALNLYRNESLCYPNAESADITSIHEEDGVRVGRRVHRESDSVAYSEEGGRRHSSSSFSDIEGMLDEVSEIETSSQ